MNTLIETTQILLAVFSTELSQRVRVEFQPHQRFYTPNNSRIKGECSLKAFKLSSCKVLHFRSNDVHHSLTHLPVKYCTIFLSFKINVRIFTTVK